MILSFCARATKATGIALVFLRRAYLRRTTTKYILNFWRPARKLLLLVEMILSNGWPWFLSAQSQQKTMKYAVQEQHMLYESDTKDFPEKSLRWKRRKIVLSNRTPCWTVHLYKGRRQMHIYCLHRMTSRYAVLIFMLSFAQNVWTQYGMNTVFYVERSLYAWFCYTANATVVSLFQFSFSKTLRKFLINHGKSFVALLSPSGRSSTARW